MGGATATTLHIQPTRPTTTTTTTTTPTQRHTRGQQQAFLVEIKPTKNTTRTKLNSKARQACGATSTKRSRPDSRTRPQCRRPITSVAPSPSRMSARMGAMAGPWGVGGCDGVLGWRGQGG